MLGCLATACAAAASGAAAAADVGRTITSPMPAERPPGLMPAVTGPEMAAAVLTEAGPGIEVGIRISAHCLEAKTLSTGLNRTLDVGECRMCNSDSWGQTCSMNPRTSGSKAFWESRRLREASISLSTDKSAKSEGSRTDASLHTAMIPANHSGVSHVAEVTKSAAHHEVLKVVIANSILSYRDTGCSKRKASRSVWTVGRTASQRRCSVARAAETRSCYLAKSPMPSNTRLMPSGKVDR